MTIWRMEFTLVNYCMRYKVYFHLPYSKEWGFYEFALKCKL